MFDWLKKLISPRRPTDVEYRQPPEDSPPIVSSGPMTMPYPPAAPLETPAANESEQSS